MVEKISPFGGTDTLALTAGSGLMGFVSLRRLAGLTSGVPSRAAAMAGP
jgi:hypothetical protein